MTQSPPRSNTTRPTRIGDLIVVALLALLAVLLTAFLSDAHAQTAVTGVTNGAAPASPPPWTYSLGLLCAMLAYAARVVVPKSHWLHEHVGAGVLAIAGGVIAAGLSAIGAYVQTPAFTWSSAGLVALNAALGALGALLGAANPSFGAPARAALVAIALLGAPARAEVPPGVASDRDATMVPAGLPAAQARCAPVAPIPARDDRTFYSAIIGTAGTTTAAILSAIILHYTQPAAAAAQTSAALRQATGAP